MKKGRKRKTVTYTKMYILELFTRGVFIANIDTGEIKRHGGGPLSPYMVAGDLTHPPKLKVTLRYQGVDIGKEYVHDLIWMVGADSPLPQNWKVIHIDGDTQNNTWDNLLCVHRDDLRKILHGEEKE